MNFKGLQQIGLFAAIVSSLTLAGCDKSELAEVQVQENASAQAVEGQYMVIFKPLEGEQRNASPSETHQRQQAYFSELRFQLISDLAIEKTAVRDVFQGTVNGFSAILTVDQVSSLSKRPEIAFLEKDKYLTLTKPVADVGNIKTGKSVIQPVDNAKLQLPYTTVVPLDGEHIPWSIEQVGYGDGTGKTVWVIDSGVDTEHPDLTVDLVKSKSFIYGINSVKDGFGHGTKVAGIIAAKNNGSGMIGVAANATIVALRVFDDAGQGSTSRVVSAVNYVVANGQPGDVVNISLGGGISSTLDNAVKVAASRGFIFAIAAGNSGVDCSSTSPARLDAPNVYTVSAVDNFNQLWEKSNYGLPVDYAAPGMNITSTKLNGGLSVGSNGTSFAAPHVAGILLLRKDIVARGTVIGDKDSYPEPVASAR